MTSAKDVAKYLITLVDTDGGDVITALKLQKLLYYCQGFYLAIHDRPLFSERILRWDHGPVVAEVWKEYKDSGANPLPPPAGFNFGRLSGAQREIIDEVYMIYGALSATALRNMTHEEPPWRNTAKDKEITHETLTEFFKTRLVNA